MSVVNFDSIPDDVWFEIFSVIDDPQLLAILSRTSQLFRVFARRPLLRQIQWLKPHATQQNLDSWDLNPLYATARNAPQKVTVGIPFKFDWREYGTMTAEKRLSDRIWENLPLFTSLHTLVLQNTTISFFSYSIFSNIPSLRHLTISHCTFIRICTSFSRNMALRSTPGSDPSQTYLNSFPFSSLPFTHLEIDRLYGNLRPDYWFHPINLIAASSLTHLSLLWTENNAAVCNFAGHHMSSLTHLRISMPFLSRDVVNSLVAFLAHVIPTSPTGGPFVDLMIERHNIDPELIRTGIVIPIRNITSYVGPSFVSFFDTSSVDHNSPLTSVRMNSVPVGLTDFMQGVGRLPSRLRVLEVMIKPGELDYEMFLAVSELFKDIEEVVFRYGDGKNLEGLEFLVPLASNVLCKLPKLSTFKFYQDDDCIVTDPSPPVPHNLNPYFNPHFANMNVNFQERKPSRPSSIEHVIEHVDLEDLLIGWNRYCKKLRTVQLRKGVVWERRWEGDIWRERVVGSGDGGVNV